MQEDESRSRPIEALHRREIGGVNIRAAIQPRARLQSSLDVVSRKITDRLLHVDPKNLEPLDRPASQPAARPADRQRPRQRDRPVRAPAFPHQAEVSLQVVDAAPQPQAVLEFDLHNIVRLQALEPQLAAYGPGGVHTRGVLGLDHPRRQGAREVGSFGLWIGNSGNQ